MLTAACYSVLLLLPPLVNAHIAFAANDADFSLSPSNSTYTVDDEFTLTISETSAASDNTGSVEAVLLYSDNLQYTGSDQGSFAPCSIQQPNDGEVDISCTSDTPVSGTQTVATVNFATTSTGPASASLSSVSDIDDINGNSVWDGQIPTASYTIGAPSPIGSTDGGSGGAGASDNGGASSGGDSTQPGSTGSNARAQASATAKKATLNLTVTDRNGKPVNGAKASIDNNQTTYTDAQGRAELSSLATGTHTLAVTAPGKLTYTATLTLSADTTENVSLEPASQKTLTATVTYIAVALTIIGAAGYRYKGGFGTWRQPPPAPAPGIVVGSGTPFPAESPNPVSITPASPAGTPQILVSPEPPKPGTIVTARQPAGVAPPQS